MSTTKGSPKTNRSNGDNTAPEEEFYMDPGREAYLIAEALYKASEEMFADPMGAHSNAEDMQFILKTKFPGMLRLFPRLTNPEELESE